MEGTFVLRRFLSDSKGMGARVGKRTSRGVAGLYGAEKWLSRSLPGLRQSRRYCFKQWLFARDVIYGVYFACIICQSCINITDDITP